MTQCTPAQARELADKVDTNQILDDRIFSEALRSLANQVEALTNNLVFVERWAVHHAAKPHMTAAQALGVIAHYPAIRAITKSYVDGYVPETFDPYAEIEKLTLEWDALKAYAIKYTWVLEALTEPPDCKKELLLFAAIDRLDLQGLTPIELVAYLDSAIADAMKEPK